MDVKQIQYFSLVSSTGSFNAAAKQLYISVPGLVKAMDRLENELGVQLFVRRRSGVTLTPAGQALARYAPRYIRKYEMIVSNVRKAAAQREMRAEVCMTWGMLSFFPRNFLSRFVLSNPDMSLSTHNCLARLPRRRAEPVVRLLMEIPRGAVHGLVARIERRFDLGHGLEALRHGGRRPQRIQPGKINLHRSSVPSETGHTAR